MSKDWFDSNKDVSFELESADCTSLEQALQIGTIDEDDHKSKWDHKVQELFKSSLKGNAWKSPIKEVVKD